MEIRNCCFCGKKLNNYGNNPDGAMWKDESGNIVEYTYQPDDRCCDDCNNHFVIPGRLYKLYHQGGGKDDTQ